MTTLVSRATGSAGLKDRSQHPTMSSDGRYVAFSSEASKLDPADNDKISDVFVRDLRAGTTTLVSRATGPRARRATATAGADDLRRRALRRLLLGCDEPRSRRRRRDARRLRARPAGRHDDARQPRRRAAGAKGNATRPAPAISGDGRYVSFESLATNLDPDDTDGRATCTCAICRPARRRSSAAPTAPPAPRATTSRRTRSISGDGRFVTFASRASNLDPEDRRRCPDVFVRDLQAATTTLVSRADRRLPAPRRTTRSIGSPRSPADGRYVTFTSAAIEPRSRRRRRDLGRVRARPAGRHDDARQPRRRRRRRQGQRRLRWSRRSRRRALRRVRVGGVEPRPGDGDDRGRVRARSCRRDDDARQPRDRRPGDKATATRTAPDISGDGRYVAFTSAASNLDPDGDSIIDVFVRDVLGDVVGDPPTTPSSPPQPPQADKTPPKAELSGSKSQKLGASVDVTISCPDGALPRDHDGRPPRPEDPLAQRGHLPTQDGHQDSRQRQEGDGQTQAHPHRARQDQTSTQSRQARRRKAHDRDLGHRGQRPEADATGQAQALAAVSSRCSPGPQGTPRPRVRLVLQETSQPPISSSPRPRKRKTACGRGHELRRGCVGVRPLPHDARRVPSPRPRGRRVGGGTTWSACGSCRSRRRCKPGEIRARLPAAAPEQPEPFARAAARSRRGRPARHHALAVARLVRLLPGQRVGAVDPRRAGRGRARRAGDAVGDEPGADGDRGARPRLARRPARAAAALQDGGRARRRRHPDERVGLHPSGARRRARARRRAAARRSTDLVAYGSSQAHSSVERGRARRGLLARAPARRRRRLRAARRTRCATRSSRIAPPASCRRSSRAPSAPPAPARSTPSPRSPTSRASTACGTTWTPRGRARRCSARSSARTRRAPSAPTATRSTRTSGCSRTSTATCCGSPTARR